MVVKIMCLTQTEMINNGLEDIMEAMFSRWDEALKSGEVPAIESHQWYSSLHLSSDNYGRTIIVAFVEEYGENSIIDYVRNVCILFHKDNTVLCAACNYAEGTESIYGTLYCTSCANM